ncbi:MAG: ComF family protein [Hyphomicrobiales bacterium]|nr:ComF family protein [Hyphomicrobiales bacterium]
MRAPRLTDALGPFAAAARRVAAGALDLVYPPVCIACRRAVAGHFALCPACWTKLRFIERPYCERLGAPFDVDLDQPGLLSPEAIANPPVFSRARSVVLFDDGPARLIVHRLKYYDRLELARPVGKWMARAGAELLDEADVIAPVPMHRLRLAARRHNQAAVLAAAVSRETGVPAAMRALERVKPTAPQVGLSRARRAANMQGAFRVAEEGRLAVLDRRVVLVDDVMTSGATANAAARALLRAGARRIDVLTFARVVTGA